MKPGEGGQYHCLTFAPEAGLLREIPSPIGISASYDAATTAADQVPKISMFTAIWDTGATNSTISQAVVDTCGLKQLGVAEVHGVSSVLIQPTYLVHVQIYNGPTIESLVATLGEIPGGDVLIGMDVITLGDFAITNKGGNTVFSFRIPSQYTVDYVKELKQQKLVGKPRSNRAVIPRKRGR